MGFGGGFGGDEVLFKLQATGCENGVLLIMMLGPCLRCSSGVSILTRTIHSLNDVCTFTYISKSITHFFADNVNIL